MSFCLIDFIFPGWIKHSFIKSGSSIIIICFKANSRLKFLDVNLTPWTSNKGIIFTEGFPNLSKLTGFVCSS